MPDFDDLDVKALFESLSRRLDPQEQFDANYRLGEKMLRENMEMQRELADLMNVAIKVLHSSDESEQI